MKKIKSLFMRNYDGDGLVRNEVVPGSEWVLAGEGIATRKWDGTCCMIRNGVLYKRYDAKKGRTPPPSFEPAQEPDPVTGHHPGWLPVGPGPEDKWFREVGLQGLEDGTYELCGPKIGTNPEKFDALILIKHGRELIENPPERTFDGIKTFFESHEIEGIVYHHPDGRMIKIKKKDFGLKRN